MSPSSGTAPTDSAWAVPVLMGMVFLSLIGFGVVVPLLPSYATVFDASPWQVTMIFAVFAGGQFFGELFWGRLSDRIGRKPVIIGTILACSLGYVALAFAPNIWLATLARLFAGFFSGNISAIQGYIVDVTSRDRVAARLGLVGAALSLGFIVGPILGGLLARPELGAAGLRPPLLVAAGLCAVAAVCAAVFVRGHSPATGADRPGPFQAIGDALTDRVLQRLLATTFFSFAGISAMWSVFGLWGAERFHWGPREIGMAMAAIGVAAASSQGLLSGWTSRRLGEARTMVICFLLAAALMLAQAAGPPMWVAVALMMLIAAAHTLTQPATAAMVSRAASEGQQGATLGANNAASAVSRVLGPVIAGVAFASFGSWSPFVLGTGLLILAAAMGWAGSRALDQRLRDTERTTRDAEEQAAAEARARAANLQSAIRSD